MKFLYKEDIIKRPSRRDHIHMTILSVLRASQPFISSKFDLPRRSGDIVIKKPRTNDNGGIGLVAVLQLECFDMLPMPLPKETEQDLSVDVKIRSHPWESQLY